MRMKFIYAEFTAPPWKSRSRFLAPDYLITFLIKLAAPSNLLLLKLR